MQEFQGWKLFPKTTIVYSLHDTLEHNGVAYPKAYVCDASSKKTLETAKKWAGGNDTITPNIVETDNKDFNMTVVQFAGNSNNGGKLSFWMCIFRKNGIPDFAANVNTEILCKIILQSNLHQGEVDHKMFFATKNGQLGTLHEQMVEYQDALQDAQTKKDIAKNKTSDWQIGGVYASIYYEDVMLGYFPKILVDKSVTHDTQFVASNAITTIVLDFKKPQMQALYTPFFTSTSNPAQLTADKLKYGCKKKPPARQFQRQLFQVTDTYYKDIADIILNEAKIRIAKRLLIAQAEHNPEKGDGDIGFLPYFEQALWLFHKYPQLVINITDLAIRNCEPHPRKINAYNIQYDRQVFKYNDQEKFWEKVKEILLSEMAKQTNAQATGINQPKGAKA